MGLGLPTAGDGGDFITYCKYNAKAGRFYTKPDGGGDEYEVPQVTAIFDFENIKTGAFLFLPGAAPVKHFDSSVGAQDAEPLEKGKRGFEILLYAEQSWQGVREFMSTAGVVNEVMNALYDQWENAPERGQGLLPVVTCEGVTAVESKHGTNYQPNFSITGWTQRPAGFSTDEQTQPQAPAAPAPQAQEAAQVPPPAPAPQAAPQGGSMF